MRELTIATYNVHQWFGADGRRDFDRGIRVIRELKADIIGLQEVTVPHHEEPAHMEERLAASTGMRVVFGPTMLRGDTSFGNVLLHRHNALAIRHHDLPATGREPRGAIEALIDVSREDVRIITTHMGLRASERKRQIRYLLRRLDSLPSGLLCLLGDFNHWLPWAGPLSALNRWFGQIPRLRTFPASLPLLGLDHIWVRPRERLSDIRVHRSGAARVASDHLPLMATVRIP
jgi:endonuclease/exonuclease/phosphatase family metal-dependent hydrolase